jgi:hypothetical protein
MSILEIYVSNSDLDKLEKQIFGNIESELQNAIKLRQFLRHIRTPFGLLVLFWYNIYILRRIVRTINESRTEGLNVIKRN